MLELRESVNGHKRWDRAELGFLKEKDSITLQGQLPDCIIPVAGGVDQRDDPAPLTPPFSRERDEILFKIRPAFLEDLVAIELHQPQNFLIIPIPLMYLEPVTASFQQWIAVFCNSLFCAFKIMDFYMHT